MYYGKHSNDGKYIGFYTKDIHGDKIPTPNIELNEEQWQEALTGNYKVINGKHTYAPYVPTKNEIRQQQLATLDAEYQPQFLELSQVLSMAILSDNTNIITSIKSNYAALKAEYNAKRGEING